jgi:hypothetical protein
MAPTFVPNSAGASTGGATAASLSATYTTNNTLDNFLVAVFRLPAGSGHTFLVTDTQLNTWNLLLNFTNATERYQLWYVPGCKAGANTVTITPDSSTFLRILIAEYSGVVAQSQSVTDGSNSGIATSTAVNSGAVVTTNATDLLIGFTANQTADNVTFTPTSGFTVRRNVDGNLQLADLNTVATGSFSFTGTDGSSVQWGAGIAAFKASTTTSPYVGYGTNDCGGQALPAQEPSSTTLAAQTNAINQLTSSGGRGPTNTGVFYQSGGGGTTPGTGQIFPSGRS